jgi:plastocyanin
MLSVKRFYLCLLLFFLAPALLSVSQVSATIHDVSIVDFFFNPSSINVTAGDSVKWTNNGAVTHTSTSDSGVWDSSPIPPGSSFTRQFSTPGSFPYHCEIHTTMLGTVIVSPTSVGDGNSAGIPKNYSLHQNFPNPFNSSTRISFYLPKSGNVKLEVYNILGQKIKTLLEKVEEPGAKTIFWDGTDDKGLNASTGIYFYRLTAADFVDTRKMVYLK